MGILISPIFVVAFSSPSPIVEIALFPIAPALSVTVDIASDVFPAISLALSLAISAVVARRATPNKAPAHDGH